MQGSGANLSMLQATPSAPTEPLPSNPDDFTRENLLDAHVLHTSVLRYRHKKAMNFTSLRHEVPSGCAPGTFSDRWTDKNQTVAVQLNAQRSGGCNDCPHGKYQNLASSYTCKDCPDGKFTPRNALMTRCLQIHVWPTNNSHAAPGHRVEAYRQMGVEAANMRSVLSMYKPGAPTPFGGAVRHARCPLSTCSGGIGADGHLASKLRIARDPTEQIFKCGWVANRCNCLCTFAAAGPANPSAHSFDYDLRHFGKTPRPTKTPTPSALSRMLTPTPAPTAMPTQANPTQAPSRTPTALTTSAPLPTPPPVRAPVPWWSRLPSGCKPGKFGVAWAGSTSKCAVCPHGKYQNRKDKFECKECPKGKMVLRGRLACKAVAVFVRAYHDRGDPLYQGNANASRNCPAGTHPARGMIDGCRKLWGTGPPLGSSPCGACFACKPGKYQDQPGQWSCKDCPSGKFQPKRRMKDDLVMCRTFNAETDAKDDDAASTTVDDDTSGSGEDEDPSGTATGEPSPGGGEDGGGGRGDSSFAAMERALDGGAGGSGTEDTAAGNAGMVDAAGWLKN